jgi:hypothetical protein
MCFRVSFDRFPVPFAFLLFTWPDPRQVAFKNCAEFVGSKTLLDAPRQFAGQFVHMEILFSKRNKFVKVQPWSTTPATSSIEKTTRLSLRLHLRNPVDILRESEE